MRNARDSNLKTFAACVRVAYVCVFFYLLLSISAAACLLSMCAHPRPFTERARTTEHSSSRARVQWAALSVRMRPIAVLSSGNVKIISHAHTRRHHHVYTGNWE